MTHSRHFILIALWLCWPVYVQAQHHHGMQPFQHFSYPYTVYPGYFGSPYWSQTAPIATYANPVFYAPIVATAPIDPIKVPSAPSTPLEREKSLEHQKKGDKRLKAQNWSDARVSYASSVKLAPDRAEAHMRLGLCYVAIQRFDSAIREIKRAILLDPTITTTTATLDTIFGPDNKIALTSMISKLGDWVREDIKNSDRLFLLGAVLYFNRDHRCNDAFETAIRLIKSADKSHIIAFLKWPLKPAPEAPQAFPDGIPDLKTQPAGMTEAHQERDIRFAKFPLRSSNISGATPIPGAPVPMP